MFRVLKGRSLRKDEFAYGWQEGERVGVDGDGKNGEMIKGWEGARIFVACELLLLLLLLLLPLLVLYHCSE